MKKRTLKYSGTVYSPFFILRYVAWTSLVWNGGFPARSANTITPRDHTSTSNEWPVDLEPRSTSGAM